MPGRWRARIRSSRWDENPGDFPRSVESCQDSFLVSCPGALDGTRKKAIMLYFELGIVTILIVTNGLLSMSELAIVSSRPARLAALAERSVQGSRRALALASDPGKFLSTVQIGITLIGVLSGAFSGATLGQRLSLWLVELGLSQGAAAAIGVGLVVGILPDAPLIAAELWPKQIGLRDTKSVA